VSVAGEIYRYTATTCTTRTQISPARGPKLASPEDIDAPVSPHGPAMEASYGRDGRAGGQVHRWYEIYAAIGRPPAAPHEPVSPARGPKLASLEGHQAGVPHGSSWRLRKRRGGRAGGQVRRCGATSAIRAATAALPEPDIAPARGPHLCPGHRLRAAYHTVPPWSRRRSKR
jgi:hypothetical protein